MKKLFIIIAVLLFNRVYCQSVSQYLAEVDALTQRKNYEGAIWKLDKLEYLFNDSILELKLIYDNYSKVYSLYGNQDSADYYSLESDLLAFELNEKKEEAVFKKRNDYYLKKSVACLQNNDYDSFEYFLQNVNLNYLLENEKKNIELFKCFFYIKDDDIINAKAHLLNQAQNKNDTVITIENIAHLEKVYKKYSPNKVQNMSRILPGLGQLYTKNYKAALNSFLLNGTLITASVIFSINYSLLEGLLFTFPFIQRYYSGGHKRAALLAILKIEQEKQKILKNIYLNWSTNNIY